MNPAYQKTNKLNSKAVAGGSDLLVAKTMVMIAMQIFKVPCKITCIEDCQSWIHPITVAATFLPSCQRHDLVSPYLINKPVVEFSHMWK